MTGAPVVYNPSTTTFDVPPPPVDPAVFTVAGLGEKHNGCGTWHATHFHMDPTGPLGSSIRYSPTHCRRMTCPTCYTIWSVERAFEVAVTLEAYARVTGQRPAHVVASRSPEEMVSWARDDYKIKLHRRGTRQLKKNGAVGGFRANHTHRIDDQVKPALRDAGYGQLDGNYQGRGFWKGVHDNALNLDDWHDYVTFGPHDHHIVFPSFLEPNTTHDYLLKKIRTIETTEQLVGTIVYLLSHVGKVAGTLDQPTVMWGVFRGRTPWVPADHLTPEALLALRREIAALLHREWNDDRGCLDYIRDDDDDDIPWMDIRDLSSALDKYRDYDSPGRGWNPNSGMTEGEYRFWFALMMDQRWESAPWGEVCQPLVMAMCEYERPDSVTPYWTRPLTDDEMDKLDDDLKRIESGDYEPD